jgi:anti-sigma factor RsiW
VTAHTDDGRLLAYLDRELPTDEWAEVETHLGGCLTCRQELARVRARAATVTGALLLLDHHAPTDAAWAAVREAVGAAPGDFGTPWSSGGTSGRPDAHRSAWSGGRWALARAAGLVLLLAGGAAAAVIPGSPLRSWIFGDEPAAQADALPAATTATAAAESGSWTRAVDGTVVLSLLAPAGTRVEVRWDGPRAGILGPADTRYVSREDGQLEAETPAGPVRVEIPADIRRATLIVNGAPSVEIRDGRVTSSPADAEGNLAPGGGALRFVVR